MIGYVLAGLAAGLAIGTGWTWLIMRGDFARGQQTGPEPARGGELLAELPDWDDATLSQLKYGIVHPPPVHTERLAVRDETNRMWMDDELVAQLAELDDEMTVVLAAADATWREMTGSMPAITTALVRQLEAS